MPDDCSGGGFVANVDIKTTSSSTDEPKEKKKKEKKVKREITEETCAPLDAEKKKKKKEKKEKKEKFPESGKETSTTSSIKEEIDSSLTALEEGKVSRAEKRKSFWAARLEKEAGNPY